MVSRRSPPDSTTVWQRQNGIQNNPLEDPVGADKIVWYGNSAHSPFFSPQRRRQVPQKCKTLKGRKGKVQPQFGQRKGRKRSSLKAKDWRLSSHLSLFKMKDPYGAT